MAGQLYRQLDREEGGTERQSQQHRDSKGDREDLLAGAAADDIPP